MLWGTIWQAALAMALIANQAMAEDPHTCHLYCNKIQSSCQSQGKTPDCELKVANCNRDCEGQPSITHGYMTAAQCRIIGETLGPDGWCRK